MPVPVLLVAGFLGAGKTTVVNQLLVHAEGRRIAAVVNDFGAVNIDAELMAGAEDGVISLANGCICCTLEGDLLRTLASLLRRDPRPDAIVIETSGVADPADIVRNLMDPVIWREAPLETVLCVVDAAGSLPLTDALLQSQLRSADLIALTKPDLVSPSILGERRAAIAAARPGAMIVDCVQGALPIDLVFPPDPAPPTSRDPGRRRPSADRFQSFTWTSEHPVSLTRLQAAIGRLAPRLARAKGVVESAEQPGRPLLLQLVGTRATLAPAAASQPSPLPRCRLVFISEIGRLPDEELRAALDACLAA